MTPARRLAAILAVDFMGNSRLMRSEDEAVTARRFAKHCEAQDVPGTALALRCLAKTLSQVTVVGRLGSARWVLVR